LKKIKFNNEVARNEEEKEKILKKLTSAKYWFHIFVMTI